MTEFAVPPYDAIAEFYDEDMGRNNPGLDIRFYAERASRAGRRVLELACGTGRITLPLVRQGLEVDAVDGSLPMLQQLEAKARAELSPEELGRLAWHWSNMRDFEFGKKFDAILCPFSGFTYLVEDADQLQMLRRVRAHLAPAGVFLLDTFVPHYEDLLMPDDHIYHDYRRRLEKGGMLEREKTIQKDLTKQINIVRRTYRFLNDSGELQRTVCTESTIRYRFRNELKLFLESEGFELIEEYGDFEGKPYSYSASMMVLVCRQRGSGFAGS
jgi:SAM-dependent methyltransferase